MIRADLDQVGAQRVALAHCDWSLAIGTSGTVWPASSFVRAAEYAGAHTVLINQEAVSGAPYAEIILGAAEEVLPALLR